MRLEWGIRRVGELQYDEPDGVKIMPDEECADFAATSIDDVVFRYAGEWTKA